MEQLGFRLADFYDIEYLKLFRKYIKIVRVSLKSDNNNGTLHEDLCRFIIISRAIILRIRNVSDKSCGENQNTHFMSNKFFSENRAVYEIMWKNMVEPDRPQITI